MYNFITEEEDKYSLVQKMIKHCIQKGGFPSNENIDRFEKDDMCITKSRCQKECLKLQQKLDDSYVIQQEINRNKLADVLKKRKNTYDKKYIQERKRKRGYLYLSKGTGNFKESKNADANNDERNVILSNLKSDLQPKNAEQHSSGDKKNIQNKPEEDEKEEIISNESKKILKSKILSPKSKLKPTASKKDVSKDETKSKDKSGVVTTRSKKEKNAEELSPFQKRKSMIEYCNNNRRSSISPRRAQRKKGRYLADYENEFLSFDSISVPEHDDGSLKIEELNVLYEGITNEKKLQKFNAEEFAPEKDLSEEEELRNEINDLEIKVIYLEKKNTKPLDFILSRFGTPDHILGFLINLFESTMNEVLYDLKEEMEKSAYFKFKVINREIVKKRINNNSNAKNKAKRMQTIFEKET